MKTAYIHMKKADTKLVNTGTHFAIGSSDLFENQLP
jgi:hypothetical protein